MYESRDYVVTNVFNEESQEYSNVPEFTFEEHYTEYLANYEYGTLDFTEVTISFSDIVVRFYYVAHECEDETAVINAGFSKEGFRLEAVTKEGEVVLFDLGECGSSEYNWVDDYFDDPDNYKEVNPDNVCTAYLHDNGDYYNEGMDHNIVVNYGQVNGHAYREYHTDVFCEYFISVVEAECEEDWIKRGYTIVDGIGYRFETDEGVYQLTINEDLENEIDLNFLEQQPSTPPDNSTPGKFTIKRFDFR